MGRVYEGGSVEACAPERAPITADPARRLGYQPALDGVRGLAVALVVVFHLDVGWFSGGYLGVSVFFTLSGFLITTLLLERFDDTGGLDLRGFYLRRIKRLVPASTATLLAISAMTALGGFRATDRSSGDVIAAALNVFNWREFASGTAYADLFSGDSPVAHFWSLAIEEQFYVVWPVALLVLLRSQRVGPTRLLSVVTVLFLLSSLTTRFGSADVVYFASWARAAEVLAGVWLAVWWSRSEGAPAWWRHLPGPAIGLVVVLALVTPAASGWAYSGGLPLFALISVALIAGLQVPGRTRTAMSFAPLVALGRVSYGVYLVHWPVFVFVDEARMGVDGWNLAITRLGLTALISMVMYGLLERPIRRSTRRVSFRKAAATTVGVSLGIVAVAIVWLDSPATPDEAPAVLAAPAAAAAAPTSAIDPSSDATAMPASNTTPSDPVGTPHVDAEDAERRAALRDDFIPTPAALAALSSASEPSPADDLAIVEDVRGDRPTTIAVFGDSVPAWLMRDAAVAFSRRDVVLINGANEACDGAVALPLGRDRNSEELRPPDTCTEWTQSYPMALASYDEPVEVGLLVIGQAATVDRLIEEVWTHPCDSMSWYEDDVRERIEFLRSVGIEPVIALPARFGRRVTFILPDDYADRMSCVRASLTALAADEGIDTVDLDGLLCIGEDCEGRRTRDGVHIDPEVAGEVLDELVDLTLAAR